MLKLNTQKVLKQAEEERNRPKPLPKIKAIQPRIPQPGSKPVTQAIDSMLDPSSIHVTDLSMAEREYSDLRQERNKLSTTISFKVEQGASTEDLKSLYEQIESFRDLIRSAYDKISRIKNGPANPTTVDVAPVGEAQSLFELKDQKRKLVDKRCKLQAKLKGSAKPSRPDQIAAWTLELEQANAQYNDLEQRIRKLEGKA